MIRKHRVMSLVMVVVMTITLFGLGVTVKAAELPSTQNVYRLYNPNSGEHFYTVDSKEKDNLYSAGWNYEGIAWVAPTLGDPVYRVYNANSGEHHYTKDADEKDYLVSITWKDEGICWYTDEEEVACSKCLYRLYNPNHDLQHEAGSHHHTLSDTERDYLVSIGWNYEGISFCSAHDITYHEGVYIEALEMRGSQVYCNECGEMIFDGWDHSGTDFDSLEEIMAIHLNEKHGGTYDIDYVDPARWEPFVAPETQEEYIKAALEYSQYVLPRIAASEEVKSHFTIDYEGSDYSIRPKQYIIEPGYAVCSVCGEMFYEK